MRTSGIFFKVKNYVCVDMKGGVSFPSSRVMKLIFSVYIGL